ncbi:MAG TPA: cardiolipin synthase [Spirochaetia bacterium]|nr:cardiolipin synthase [Spirochaetia bacterium]
MVTSEIVYQILSYIFFLYLIVITIKIILENRPPEELLAWLVILIFLPYVGAIFYILTGIDWKKQNRKIIKHIPEKAFENFAGTIIDHQKEFVAEVSQEIDNDIAKTATMLLKSSNSPITMHNSCEFYFDGSSHFFALMRDLEHATSSIHMEYYIWRSDELGERIKDILIRKRREGVEVRLIFDGIGCFGKISRRYRRELKEAGIEFRYFLDPLSLLWGRMINYRNHRKIVVIDGKIAYSGGMNIGTEYVSGGKRYPSWRDTHMRLGGESVQLLQSVFFSDWHNSGGRIPDSSKYFCLEGYGEAKLPVQIVTSGPDSDWESIKQLFFLLISNADKEIYIQSPYFIPDSAIMEALETAALSGISVQLMITGVPDKRIPWYVAQTYFENLLKAGVRIFLYTRGFFHAKVFMADSSISTVGTCNMDLRSFSLDYEINAVFYDKHVALTLKESFERDREFCTEVKYSNFQKRNIFVRLRNSILRVLAPVL